MANSFRIKGVSLCSFPDQIIYLLRCLYFPSLLKLSKRTLAKFGRISRNLVLAYDNTFSQNAVTFGSLL